jgi:hypothetical protein
MKKLLFSTSLLLLTLISLALIPGFVSTPQSNEVAYPEGYRNWTHVKTMIVEPGHPLYDPFGGIHHIYANEKALEGYKNGKFPDSAVIVFDLLEVVQMENAINEGSRKVVAVMQKNSELFPETGGWGFEGFKGDSMERTVKEMKADCFSCHYARMESDFVFSKYRK